MSQPLTHTVTDADMEAMYDLGVTHCRREVVDEVVDFLRSSGFPRVASDVLRQFRQEQPDERTVYMALFKNDDIIHGPYDSIQSAHEAAEGWSAVTDIMPVTVRGGKFVRVNLKEAAE